LGRASFFCGSYPGVHIQLYHIGKAVVIYIGYILPHGVERGMLKIFFRTIGKSTVVVVDVQDVVGDKKSLDT
jgi:hypothetical protein